ncbi:MULTISPECIES: hypothetical protein [Aerosakkonema]|uniref:hypothetical protein n=1 Tax=Aerosakkonema TaxID=1246629 RepID=UPI0035BC095D
MTSLNSRLTLLTIFSPISGACQGLRQKYGTSGRLSSRSHTPTNRFQFQLANSTLSVEIAQLYLKKENCSDLPTERLADFESLVTFQVM